MLAGSSPWETIGDRRGIAERDVSGSEIMTSTTLAAWTWCSLTLLGGARPAEKTAQPKLGRAEIKLCWSAGPHRQRCGRRSGAGGSRDRAAGARDAATADLCGELREGEEVPSRYPCGASRDRVRHRRGHGA